MVIQARALRRQQQYGDHPAATHSSNALQTFLLRECVCESQEEAEAIVADWEPDEYNLVIRDEFVQALQDYVGLEESEASQMYHRWMMLHHANDIESDSSEDDTAEQIDAVATDEDRDDGQVIGEGECELCERRMQLTRHHMIPRSTWPRLEPRLLNAWQAHDKNRAALIIGEHLLHLLPPKEGAERNERTTKKAAPLSERAWVRSHVRQALQRTCALCRPCHSAVHKSHDNMTLALEFNTVEKMLSDESIFKFCQWASKQRIGKHRLKQHT